MKLLRADADLRAEAEFKAVRKSGGGIVVYGCCVDLMKETFCARVVLRHDALGMFGSKLPNMIECAVKIVYDT